MSPPPSVEELVHSLSTSISNEQFEINFKKIHEIIKQEEKSDEIVDTKTSLFLATNQIFIETINNTFMNPKSSSSVVCMAAFISARIVEASASKNLFANSTPKTTVYAISKAMEVHCDNPEVILHLGDFIDLLLSSSSSSSEIKKFLASSQQLINAIMYILKDFSSADQNPQVEESLMKTRLAAIDFLTGALLSLLAKEATNNGVHDDAHVHVSAHPELVQTIDSLFANCSDSQTITEETSSILMSLLSPVANPRFHQKVVQLFSNEYSLRFIIETLLEKTHDFSSPKATTNLSDCLVILTSKLLNPELHGEVSELLLTLEDTIDAITKNFLTGNKKAISEASVTSLCHLIGNLTNEITSPKIVIINEDPNNNNNNQNTSSAISSFLSRFCDTRIVESFIRVLKDEFIKSDEAAISIGIAISNINSIGSTNTDNNNTNNNNSSSLFTSSSSLPDLLITCLRNYCKTPASVYSIAFSIHRLTIENPQGQSAFTNQNLIEAIDHILDNQYASTSESVFAIGVVITTIVSDSNPKILEALDLFSNERTISLITRTFLFFTTSAESAEQVGQVIFTLVHPVNKRHREAKKMFLKLKLKLNNKREDEDEDGEEKAADVERFALVEAFNLSLSSFASTALSCERVALALCQFLDSNANSSDLEHDYVSLFTNQDSIDAIILALKHSATSDESIQWVCTLIVTLLTSTTEQDEERRLYAQQVFHNRTEELVESLSIALLRHQENNSTIIRSITSAVSSIANQDSSSTYTIDILKALSASTEFVDSLATALNCEGNANNFLYFPTLICSLLVGQELLLLIMSPITTDENSSSTSTSSSLSPSLVVSTSPTLTKAITNKLEPFLFFVQQQGETTKSSLDAALRTIVFSYSLVIDHYQQQPEIHGDEILERAAIQENFRKISNIYTDSSSESCSSLCETLVQIMELGRKEKWLEISMNALAVTCLFSEGNDEFWSNVDCEVENVVDFLIEEFSSSSSSSENNNNSTNNVTSCVALADASFATRGRHVLSSSPRVRNFMLMLREKGLLSLSLEKRFIELKPLVTEGDASNPRVY